MRAEAFLCVLTVLCQGIIHGAIAQPTTDHGAVLYKPLVVNESEVVGCDGGCWVPFLAPERTCKCVVPKCTPQFSGDCNFCQRGFAVYPSEDACVSAGSQPPPPGVPSDSYPPPSVLAVFANKTNVQQTAGACPVLPIAAGAGQSSCPFSEPGLSWWQSTTTWCEQVTPAAPCTTPPKPLRGGPVPTGGTVTLPANTKVIVGACSFPSTPTFTYIRIPASSQLIFADQDFSINVGSFMVDGQLRIGSPTCRLSSRMVITFARPSGSPVTDADFGLQVSASGQVDIHGRRFSPTWTNLAATAPVGATSITVKDNVAGWQVGQQIAIVTTTFFDITTNQNEVRTITAVNGNTVSFSQPLQFAHYGGPEYQAEVGLLSRNILLQGSMSNTKGPHLRFMGRVARFSGVQNFRMGQTNVLGRYSFHYHMVGNTTQANSFVRDCSCYNSMFRCVTIHGTSGMLVQDTVAFNIQGNAFYLESGVEEQNVFDRNLAARVMPLSPMMQAGGQEGGQVSSADGLVDPADSAAAGFYALNMYNTFTNNAASGGFFGFSFPSISTPLNMFKSWTWFDPSVRPFVKFENNVAHSTGNLWCAEQPLIATGGHHCYVRDFAGGLYTGGSAWYDDSDNLIYSTERTARDTKKYGGIPARVSDDREFLNITNFKAYLCFNGITHWGYSMIITNMQVHDATRFATLLGEARIFNGLINANSGNPTAAKGFPLADPTDAPPMVGFQWYDIWTLTFVDGLTLQNYKANPSLGWWSPSVFWTTSWSDFYKPQIMTFTRNIKIVNSDPQIRFRLDYFDSGAYKQFNWIDQDGSFSGRGRPTVIGPAYPTNWWRAANNNCSSASWLGYVELNNTVRSVPFWMCDLRSTQSLARIDIEVPGVTNGMHGDGDSYGEADSQRDLLGWADQLGYTPGQRRLVITKNSGTVGYTGLRRTEPNGTWTTSGWMVTFARGAARQVDLQIVNLLRFTPLYIVLRYPVGTTFAIKRMHLWEDCLNRRIDAATSVQQFMDNPLGQRYWTTRVGNSLWLHLKLVDPGSSWGADYAAPIIVNGMVAPSLRDYELKYSVTATIPGCSSMFCSMPALVRWGFL